MSVNLSNLVATYRSKPWVLEFIDSQNAYWCRQGGGTALAICRIFLFITLYFHAFLENSAPIISHVGSVAEYYTQVPLASYTPKGLVQLFWNSPPPAQFVDMIIIIARWSTLFAIVGLFTRISMILSVLSISFIISLFFSWEPYWSHGNNVELLAGIAMMFGRAGDTLSVDALIRWFRGQKPAEVMSKHEGHYWWPCLLAQFAVALFYFAGFYSKFSGPDWNFNFDWVFSSNLRNSLALPWNIRGFEMPWNVVFVTSHPFVWKAVAFGHFITQAFPILACFLIARPMARLFEGLIFGAGVLMLGFFMNIWNLPWLFLMAFFVDWEFFIHKFKSYFKNIKIFSSTPRLQPATLNPKKLPFRFIYAFLIFYCATFLFRLSAHHLMYPFSAMTFYFGIEARKPYDQHIHYSYMYGQLTFEKGAEEQEIKIFPFANVYYISALQNNVLLDERISAIQSVSNGHKVQTASSDFVNLYATVFQIPPYPHPAKASVAHRALVSSLDVKNNKVLAASLSYTEKREPKIKGVKRDRKKNQTVHRIFNFDTTGFQDPIVQILYKDDPWSNPAHDAPSALKEIPGRFDKNQFFIAPEFYAQLPARSWTPCIIRVREGVSGMTRDFWGSILYK